MYEIGTGAEVRAFHVMPGMAGPEGELHPHDYRIEVVVRRAELDARGMVVDLDVLEAALEKTASHVRDRNLEVIQPPGADAVTVEVLARWSHATLSKLIAPEGAEHLAVRVYEDRNAFSGYAAPISSS